MLEFAERTITVRIDKALCSACKTKACVGACAHFARGILALRDGMPSVDHLPAAEVVRKGTECLACEYACLFRGNAAISIDVPVEGLDAYLGCSHSGSDSQSRYG